jgi:hypothetical protein
MRRCFHGQASIVRRDLLAARGWMGRGNLACGFRRQAQGPAPLPELHFSDCCIFLSRETKGQSLIVKPGGIVLDRLQICHPDNRRR